jgi:hypothetical protein
MMLQKTVPVWLACSMLCLTGCDQGKQLAGQAASAASASVDQALQGKSSEIAGQLKGLLAPVGVEASHVASKVASEAKAVLAKHVQPPLASDAHWLQLDQAVGLLPQQAGLFTPLSPIMPTLRQLLGPKLPVFIAAMALSTPLEKQQLIYVTGAASTARSAPRAWLMIDSKTQQLEVGLLRHGKLQVFRTAGKTLVRPDKIKLMIQPLLDAPPK